MRVLKKSAVNKRGSKKTTANKTGRKKIARSKKSLLQLNDIIIDSILDKKGEKITVIDITKIPDTATDYFVICEADSTTQVRAIGLHVGEKTKELINETPWHTEGLMTGEWILLDYISTVVHVFLKDKRHFYQLEDLWSDGIVKEF